MAFKRVRPGYPSPFRIKLACAYFFIAPALMYGVFTSRLPGLKAQIGAGDQQIGYILLALGASTLLGLLASESLINRMGARIVTALACPFFMLFICCAALSSGWTEMAALCLLTGLGVGFCDVGMNALGIALEKNTGTLCLAFLHGCSGLGGVAGSLAGSAAAACSLSPFANLVLVLGIFLLAWPWAFRLIPADRPLPAGGQDNTNRFWHLPAFIWYCGLLSLICHIAEGSAGEWGSILLHSVKGASQQQAALVFAAFTGALVITRFCTDRLRGYISDFLITAAGSLLGALGMCIALLSPWPSVCLLGYALMGAGLAPVVPIMFSLAGAMPGIAPARASAVVSVLSYAGLLLFPPVLGFFASALGLAPILWAIVAICLIMALACLPLKNRMHQDGPKAA